MSQLCSTNCCGTTGSFAPPVAYSTCEKKGRSSGIRYFGVIDCSWTPTDATSSSEWAQAKADGFVQCSPLGNVTVNAPTSTTIDVNRCGDKLVGDTEYLIDYTTHYMPSDNSDFQYFKQLFDNSGGLKFFWIDCTGLFFFCQDAYAEIAAGNFNLTASSLSLGFDFSITQVPYIADDSNNSVWTTQFSINQQGVICGIELPGVEAALCC